MTAPIKQPTFAGGEISPVLYARADNSIYEKSLRTLRNMFSMRQGGVTGRPGTMYVGTSLNHGNPVRLIPFVFNQTGLGQSYMLEFGDQYVTFYQNGANVVDASVLVTNVTQSNPANVTVALPVLSNGEIIYFSGIAGMSELNNNYYLVSNLVGTSFDLTLLDGTPVDSTAFNGFILTTGTANRPYVISSPYLQADLDDLKFAQSADILTIVNKNYAPRELKRISGAPSWTLSTFFTGAPVSGPAGAGGVGSADPGHGVFYAISSVDVNGEESDDTSVLGPVTKFGILNTKTPTVTDPITLTWTAKTGAVRYRIYRFLDANGIAGGGGGGFIGETVELTYTDPGIDPDLSIRYPLYTNPFANSNWPGTVGFTQQRRVFADFVNNPIGFAMSQPGDFYNFDTSIPGVDSDGIFGSIAGQEVNEIEFVTEIKFALMLTSGAELYVQGNGNGVITPTSINASVQSQYGASPLMPLKVGDVLLFNQALGSFIRDLSFDFAIDGYRGNDITVFASHLFENYQIVDWAYQKVPDSTIWAVRSDGVLLSCTYVREQQVLAWARHDLTNGSVENICAIPENGEYAVYLSIARVINGETVRYIERMSSRLWTDPINASYLDSFSKYDGRNTGSNTMQLIGAITIVAGVNDGISFTTGGNDYFVTIAAGEYSLIEINSAVAAAMEAAVSESFFGQPAGGKFRMLNDSTPYTFNFDVTDPHYSQSIGLTLGFPPASYPAVVNQVLAPDFPIGSFSSSDTAYLQKLTIVSSALFFVAGSFTLGQQIFLQDEEFIASQGARGSQTRLTIQQSNDFYSATVTPDGIVPSNLQNVAVTTWAQATQVISGLTHLAGQEVSIWADRFLVGSPLNSQITTVYTVPDNGILTLDKQYSVIFVGLPMIQDVQTLDRETIGGESLLATRRRSVELNIYLYNTRSFFAGSENPDTNLNNTNDDPLFELYELMRGMTQVNYDQPPELVTGQDYVIMESRWNRNGRLFIRNVDPVPLTLLAIGVVGETKSQNPGYERV